MFAYFALLSLFIFGCFFYRQPAVSSNGEAARTQRLGLDLPLALGAVLIVLMIGFRYEVGGDWDPYKWQFRIVQAVSFDQALRRVGSEVGYTALSWGVARLGLGLWLVNLICAVPLVAGLVALARQQPNPWLVLSVATPALIVQVGMGYTRQSVAVGCAMYGISQLIKGKKFAYFVVPVLIGSLFHRSALLLVPVVALILFKWRPASVLTLLAAALVFYFIILPNALDNYTAGYIKDVYEAKGAAFRVIPNAVVGAIFLFFRSSFAGTDNELRVWRGFAVLAIIAVIALALVRSTVIVDRLSVYLLPMQIVVLSAIPYFAGTNQKRSLTYTTAVVMYSVASMVIWFVFANNSRYWTPYRIYPLFS